MCDGDPQEVHSTGLFNNMPRQAQAWYCIPTWDQHIARQIGLDSVQAQGCNCRERSFRQFDLCSLTSHSNFRDQTNNTLADCYSLLTQWSSPLTTTNCLSCPVLKSTFLILTWLRKPPYIFKRPYQAYQRYISDYFIELRNYLLKHFPIHSLRPQSES